MKDKTFTWKQEQRMLAHVARMRARGTVIDRPRVDPQVPELRVARQLAQRPIEYVSRTIRRARVLLKQLAPRAAKWYTTFPPVSGGPSYPRQAELDRAQVMHEVSTAELRLRQTVNV